jgi:hypothetical protein
MKTLAAVLAIATLALAAPSTADAKGCLKGAAVGGVAGHYAGRHGVLGAAVGCLYGRHRAREQERQQQLPEQHSKAPDVGQTGMWGDCFVVETVDSIFKQPDANRILRSSSPGLTRWSIVFKKSLRRSMDARIKSGHDKSFPAARFARVVQESFASKTRAQGMPGARRTRSLVCSV